MSGDDGGVNMLSVGDGGGAVAGWWLVGNLLRRVFNEALINDGIPKP